MFGIELICSDEACAEVSEAMVASLDEVDLLVCDGCSCTLQALAVWEVVEMRAKHSEIAHLPLAA